MFNQVIAQPRESLKRYVLGLVLEQCRDLMPVEPCVLDDGLDRPRSLASVRGVPKQFRESKGVPHNDYLFLLVGVNRKLANAATRSHVRRALGEDSTHRLPRFVA
jgi:hypothetical protein